MTNTLRTLSLSLGLALGVSGAAWAHHISGSVYCDDGSGRIDAGDTPLDGAQVKVTSVGTGTDRFDTTGDAVPVSPAVPGFYRVNLPSATDDYMVALTGVGLPATASVISPLGGSHLVHIVTGSSTTNHADNVDFLLANCTPKCVGDAQCDDKNPCTDDKCEPKTGCTYTNNSSPCEDGDACTTDDKCTKGSCAGGPPPMCDDKNTCTADKCEPAKGCTHESMCLFTRTPGFWKNHPITTQGVLDAVGGVQVCGQKIDTLAADSVHSALEALCVAVAGKTKVQLARQLMAAALNGASGGGVFGNFAFCNGVCAAANPSSTSIKNCIDALNTYNNSGDNLSAPFPQESGDPDSCKDAGDTDCLIVDPSSCTIQ